MKQKDNTNTKQGHSANMLLYAVAPTPKLSTDLKALVCACRQVRPLNWCDLVGISQPLNF
jgi:hypothetical protein